MRIIYVCPTFSPSIGGVETHVREIAKRLAAIPGNEVVIYTTDPTGRLQKEEDVDGIHVRRFKSYAPGEAYYFSLQLSIGLRKESCDVLHLHSFHAFPALIASMAVKKKKSMFFTPHYHPSASSWFRDVLHNLYDPIQKSLLFNSDKVICVTEAEADLLSSRFKVPMDRFVVIPNGLDVERFRGLVARSKDGKGKEKEKDGFDVLYVGRLEKYKRVQWTLDAVSKLAKMNPGRKVTLTIVGKGPYGPALMEHAGRVGRIAGDFESIGKPMIFFKKDLSEEELAREYAKCDVFVMPSEYEAFSIATLEALAAGKPVVVSDVGFMAHLAEGRGHVMDSVEGLVEGLADIMDHPMRVDFDLKEFDWDAIARRTLDVYNAGLARAHGGE